MKHARFLISVCALFLLAACQPAANFNSSSVPLTGLNGVWADDMRAFYLAPEGRLVVLGDAGDNGISWKTENRTLTLITRDTSGTPQSSVYRVQRVGTNRLDLEDQAGNALTWKRTDEDLASLTGVITYREKLALPEDAASVRIVLSLPGGKRFAETELPLNHQGEIPFTVYYLHRDSGPAAEADIQVDVLVSGVAVLSTVEPQRVSLNNPAHIVLRRSAGYDPALKTDAPLKDTYWRLVTLNSHPVEAFPNMPEPHLILREENNQAAGSDGCNNFFFQWNQSGSKIHFGQGGSTLKLCLQGMEQAQSMMDALNKADTWTITGQQLELKSKNKQVAVFQAVGL